MALHRAFETGFELLGSLYEWHLFLHAVLRRMPVPSHARSLLRRPLEQMSRQELAHSAIKRFLPCDVAVGKIFGQDRLIEPDLYTAGSDDALDLGCKQQFPVSAGI